MHEAGSSSVSPALSLDCSPGPQLPLSRTPSPFPAPLMRAKDTQLGWRPLLGAHRGPLLSLELGPPHADLSFQGAL